MAPGSAIPLLTAVRHKALGLVACLLITWGGRTGAAEVPGVAGEIGQAFGVVSVHVEGAHPHIAGAGTVLHAGDVVTTGPRSAAQLKLADGTVITLRPESSFQIARFDIAESREQGLMTLFKGGLRAVTGFMSKRNPDAMRLKTPVATIGIRGTEFDARLCGADCAEEARSRPAAAGRAGFVKGSVMARLPSGHARPLATGAPVYSGDTILTDDAGYAVLVFRDESRVTLAPGTEFRVEQLDFDAANVEASTSVFSLLRGGLRAVSGLVGHRGRNYRMNTPVATIGIRGTGFDLQCIGSCQNPLPGAGPDGDGLHVTVTSGSIVVDDAQELAQGFSGFLADRGGQFVPAPPVEFPVPQPNTVDVPPPPPPPPSSQAPAPGLYVGCYSGTCAVNTPNNTITLTQGGASHVGEGGGDAEALPEVPPFLAEDRVLSALQSGTGLSNVPEIKTEVPQCTVQ